MSRHSDDQNTSSIRKLCFSTYLLLGKDSPIRRLFCFAGSYRNIYEARLPSLCRGEEKEKAAIFSEEQFSTLEECHKYLEDHLRRWSQRGPQHLTPEITVSSKKQVSLWEKLMRCCADIVQNSQHLRKGAKDDGGIAAKLRIAVDTLPVALYEVYREFLSEQKLTAEYISPASSTNDEGTSTRVARWAQYLGSLASDCDECEQESVVVYKAIIGGQLPGPVSFLVNETLVSFGTSNMNLTKAPYSVQELKQTMTQIGRSISNAQVSDVRGPSICTPQ